MRPAEASAAAARESGSRPGFGGPGGADRPNFVAFLSDEASETSASRTTH